MLPEFFELWNRADVLDAFAHSSIQKYMSSIDKMDAPQAGHISCCMPQYFITLLKWNEVIGVVYIQSIQGRLMHLSATVVG